MSAVLDDKQLMAIKSYETCGATPDLLAPIYGVKPEVIKSVWEDKYTPTRYKLSGVDARIILCCHGEFSAAELAERFEVDETTIYNIWNGDSHLDISRSEKDVLRSSGWELRMLALMLGMPYRPNELAQALGKSLNSIHRGFAKIRRAGFDVRASNCHGAPKNQRYYHIDNAALTRDLISLDTPRKPSRNQLQFSAS